MTLVRLRAVAGWYARLPALVAWAISLLTLIGGLFLLSPLERFASDRNARIFATTWPQHPWMISAAVLIFPIVETFVFQTLFRDGFARLTRVRWPWVIVSALAFSASLHYKLGWFAMVASGWAGFIFSATYFGQRHRSFWRAFAITASLQFTFAAGGVALAIFG